ncbi:MAG TPA: NDP-sugar synthase [Armatimonadota bacterium]|nr:NDP-sugar synthase [Armatimonadota bacterium]
MKAMILAAGVGSQLDPLTRSVPKPMAPIVNRPVMEHVINLLKRHGFTDVVANVHYLAEQVTEYFGDGSKWGINLQFSHESTLLGMAGGVKKVEDFFDDTFLVIGGDDLADIDLTKLVRQHKERKAEASMALALVKDPSEYGIVLTSERGRITRYAEKPKAGSIFSDAANTGIYLFEPSILDLIPRGIPYDFGDDLFPILVEQRMPFYGILTSGYWRDVGNLASYRDAHWDSLSGRVGIRFGARQLRKDVWVGENVDIHPEAEIEHPVLIGNNCRIGRHARVLENTVLGADCVIEENATVRRSILWEGALVPSGTTLERCVIGRGCRVPPNAAIFDGTIIAA